MALSKLEEIRRKLQEHQADAKGPICPDGSIVTVYNAQDILQRIKARNEDNPTPQVLNQDWNVVQVEGFPTAFYIRSWTEEGQAALIYLMTHNVEVEVAARPKSSNFTVVFSDPSIAAYFKLKYVD